MVTVSLTTFTDFVAATGTARLTKVRRTRSSLRLGPTGLASAPNARPTNLNQASVYALPGSRPHWWSGAHATGRSRSQTENLRYRSSTPIRERPHPFTTVRVCP